MSLMRYERSPVSSLMEDLDAIMGSSFDWSGRDVSGKRYPSVDITESQNSYMITADLPGLSREEISVTVENNVLSISGEKKREVEKHEKDRYYHLERSYGAFSRSFSLPTNVDGKNIEARYTNGVLELTLKKSEEAKPRAIEVKVS